MDLYETLGIPKNAAEAKIKKAYRKRVLATHPDRGGDAAEFQAVQTAYDVLSDPARRAKYDATGAIDAIQTDPMHLAALQALSRAFLLAFQEMSQAGVQPENEDLVKHIRQVLDKNLVELRKQAEGIDNVLKALHKTIGRFTVVDGQENVLEEIAKAQIARTENHRKANRQQVEINGRAMDILKAAGYRWENVARPGWFGQGFGGTATVNGAKYKVLQWSIG